MPLFLDNLIENFYEPVGADFRRSYARGQIFWTHIGYSREDLQLWRPTGLDPSQTTVNPDPTKTDHPVGRRGYT